MAWRGLGCVYHSRTIFCRAVPNPYITIRNFNSSPYPPYTPKGRTHELIITATPVVYREIKRRWSFLGYMSSAIDLYPLPRAQLPLSLTRSLSHAMSLCVVVQVEMLVSHAEALQCPICLDAPPSCPQVKRTSRLSFHAVNRRSRVGHGSDRKWPLNEGQRPHFRSVRVALGTGYDRVRGIGRALRNSGVSSSQQHAEGIAWGDLG